MRPLRALVIYLVVVFLGGALLSPWLYWLAQAMAGTFPQLAEAPFSRFVNRSLQLLALAGIWPLMRGLGARSAADLGLVSPAGQWGRLGGGFLLGFISLAVIATLALAAGARALPEHLAVSKIAGSALAALLTAAIVGVLEEILFRGGVFGGLRRGFDWRGALAASSAVFALLHFLSRASVPDPVTWSSGVHQLMLMFGGFADWRAFFPAFFNLALAGALLALAYQRTGNLWFSIGLHAGWIFWLKLYGAVTKFVPEANLWLWGSRRMIDGWLALGVLTLVFVALLRLLPSRSSSPAPSP